MTKYCTLALTLAIAMAQSAFSATFIPPKADGFRGLWYGYTDGTYYAGGLGTFPQQVLPMAYYAADAEKTFFVYGGATADNPTHMQTMISYYDSSTRQVARPRILNDRGIPGDGHDNPSLMLDGAGYIYVFSSAHGTNENSYIYRSTKPYSIDEFDTVLTLSGTGTGNFSYAQPWYVSGQGFMLLHSYYGGATPPARKLYYNTSADGVNWNHNWSTTGTNARPSLARIVGQPTTKSGNYQVSGMCGQTVGTMLNYSVDSNTYPRTNLYYLETSNLGTTWQTADGTTIATPLTTVGNAALVHDYESEHLYVYLKDLRYDAAGQPILFYLTTPTESTSDTSAPRTWHTAHFNDATGEWVIRDAFTSDNNYDFGSLYVESDGVWRVIAPTEAGPQPGTTGGDMAMWVSADEGATWRKQSILTHDGQYNNTYARQPVNANADFYAFWADGDVTKASASSLYFTDKNGTGVWKLPTMMTGDFATPELAYTPVSLPEPSAVCLLVIGGGMVLIGISAKHVVSRK